MRGRKVDLSLPPSRSREVQRAFRERKKTKLIELDWALNRAEAKIEQQNKHIEKLNILIADLQRVNARLRLNNNNNSNNNNTNGCRQQPLLEDQLLPRNIDSGTSYSPSHSTPVSSITCISNSTSPNAHQIQMMSHNQPCNNNLPRLMDILPSERPSYPPFAALYTAHPPTLKYPSPNSGGEPYNTTLSLVSPLNKLSVAEISTRDRSPSHPTPTSFPLWNHGMAGTTAYPSPTSTVIIPSTTSIVSDTIQDLSPNLQEPHSEQVIYKPPVNIVEQYDNSCCGGLFDCDQAEKDGILMSNKKNRTLSAG